jgi:HK97 gp10 family phage protein
MIKFKITGLSSLSNKFKDLSDVDISEIVSNTARAVEQDAKQFVPVDTGQLRDSITSNIQGNIAEVTTDAHYAAIVELGIGQAAQPYMSPAADLHRSKFREAIEQEYIRKGLGK